MLNDLLLLSGNDIPFEEARIIIHQPTVKEIAYIGEETFYTGCEFLKFSKDILEDQDKVNLEKYSDFEILMSIMKEKNVTIQKNKICMLMVLSLIFPDYIVTLTNDKISLKKNEEEFFIDNNNFETFKKIVIEMFCLKGDGENTFDYNPQGEISKRIADKLKKRHQKLAEKSDNENKKVAILSKYVSILTIGQQKDMNSLLQYTIYQLFDEFKRFELKVNYDVYLQAKMAGAKDLKEVDDWMKDIHS